MQNRKIVGRATIRIDSKVFETEKGAALTVGGIKNNPRQTTDTFMYSQTKIPSKLTCSVPVTADQSVRQLQELAGVEITFTADTGATWIIRNAVQVGEAQFADGDDGGFVALEFNGDPAEEIVR